MKKSWPLIPMVLFLISLEYRLSKTPNFYSLRREKLLQRAHEIEVLVLGASDAQANIKPSEFSVAGFTLASVNQSYTISAQLISRALKELPRLKIVLLSSSYFIWEHSLKNHPEYWRHYFLSRYMKIPGEVSLSHYLDIRNFSFFFLFWPQSFSLLLKQPNIENKYLPLRNETIPLLDSISEDGWMPFTALNPNPALQAKNEIDSLHAYIDRKHVSKNASVIAAAIEQSKLKKIETVFIRLPAHPAIQILARKEDLELEQKILQSFKDKFGLNVFDYTNLAIHNDFIDPTHLSAEGAKKLSRIINTEIIKKILRRN